MLHPLHSFTDGRTVTITKSGMDQPGRFQPVRKGRGRSLESVFQPTFKTLMEKGIVVQIRQEEKSMKYIGQS